MQDDRASHLFSEMRQSPAVSNYHGCIHRQPRMSKKIRGWKSCQRGNVTSNMQHDGDMHSDLCSMVDDPIILSEVTHALLVSVLSIICLAGGQQNWSTGWLPACGRVEVTAVYGISPCGSSRFTDVLA